MVKKVVIDGADERRAELLAVLEVELTDQRCSGSHSHAKKSPSDLLAIAPYFPTKELRIKPGTVRLQI
jgi:hypothetical protein